MAHNHSLFWCLITSILSLSSLSACQKQEEEPIYFDPQEVGDTVNEWTSHRNTSILPMAFLNEDVGYGEINKKMGQDDKESLYYVINPDNNQIVLSSAYAEEIYFSDEDAKNGDIISLYVFLPENNNIASLQLEVLTSNNNSFKGDLINIDEDNNNAWIRTVISYDTLDTLGAINLNITTVDSNQYAYLYVDDINITLGEETIATGYEYNDESLYLTYEEYFKVGTAMSASALRNTKMRQITKDNFNSVTAENECKPEAILDQQSCQELAKDDPGAVAITVKPFEKLYDFAEAHHIGVRHHTFVWYSQTPSWFFNEGYQNNGQQVSKNVMLIRMENFIRETLETINERWPGLVYAIDVANEAIENGGMRTNNNNWYNVVGEDFIYYAFKYAHEYKDEEQELYYNDFSYDYNYNNCQYAVNTLLKRVIEEQLIDGVGIQGHIDSDQNMETLMDDAKLIYSKGLKCQITELDLTINGTDENSLNKQGNAYQLLIKKVLQNNMSRLTDINAIIVWGITDDTSWKRGQNPLLFNANYTKKPAYYGFLDAINEI